MASLSLALLLLVLLLVVGHAASTRRTFEAEQGTHNGEEQFRSRAFGGRTVWLHRGEYVENRFVTESTCTVTVTQVRVSNDGDSDTITVYINGRQVGSFRTISHSNYGHYWNRFDVFGPVGSAVPLPAGSHRLKLVATSSDYYGVEIDHTVLNFECEPPPSSPPPTTSTTPPPATTSTTTTTPPPTSIPPPTSPPLCDSRTLEAELSARGQTMSRSRASNGYTVLLKDGESLAIIFQTRSECRVVRVNIRYSNDGRSDEGSVILDGSRVASFRTFSRSCRGTCWNMFRNVTQPLGSSTILPAGAHHLQVVAIATDRYGFEVDAVSLCLQCDPEPPPPPPPPGAMVVSLESESGEFTGRARLRSNASNETTVSLRRDDTIRNYFSTATTCLIQIANVSYSIDGLGVTVTLSVDDVSIGSFVTRAWTNQGLNWNIILDSGPVGDVVQLGPGNHVIETKATVNGGVEIDRVVLYSWCQIFPTISPTISLTTISDERLGSSSDRGLEASRITSIVFVMLVFAFLK